ncbi:MAG: hypothetical protein AAB353_09800 [Candidatus Hydrogenedentota bacterium]
MSQSLEKSISALRDRDAGWVTRRDAAEALGRTAADAVSALVAQKDDPDVDVRTAVRTALGWASAGLRNVKPVPQSRSYTLEELANGCAKEGRRRVERNGEEYIVHTTTKEGRGQTVYITPEQRSDGLDLIRVHTRCGPAGTDTMRWALENNLKLAHGALALSTNDGREEFVIVNCLIANEATPDAVLASVKEMAHYGDWMEQKLAGRDDL